MKLGSHVGLSGPDMYLGAVKEALSYGATAMMVYTGAPQNTIRKAMDQFLIEEAYAYMEAHGFDKNNVVVHAPYIINLANPDEEKRAFAISFLTKEVIRTHALGVKDMVLHPGSAVGKDRDQAIKWIAEGLLEVFENTKDLDVRIALETMAGKGNEIGKTFEELQAIIVCAHHHERISICLDTCHTHDAGYNIKEDFASVKKMFKNIIGLDRLKVLHINDSKNEMGAAKDRHENLGFGFIGFDAILNIVYDEDFKDVIKILETPYVNEHAPYQLEIEAIHRQTMNVELKNILEAK
jgi:deoxyribonuclease IV